MANVPHRVWKHMFKVKQKGRVKSKKYMKNKQIHIMERKRWLIIFRECLKL